MRRHRWAAASFAVMLAGIAPAQAASADDPASPETVDVVVVGDDSETTAMRSVVEELLARLGVAARITSSAHVDPNEVITPPLHPDPRVARAWVDLSSPARATLYVVDREWERILVRHVRTTPGRDELAREAMGHILENAVDALLHGARIGVVRDDVASEIELPHPVAEPGPAPIEPASAPPVRPPPLPFGIAVHGGVAYEAELYASGGIVTHGPAATLFATTRSGSIRPALWLTLQYRLPLIADAVPLGARIDSGALRALAAIDATVGRRVSARFGLGAGVDVVHLAPRIDGGGQVTPAADQVFAVFVARASVGLRIEVTRHLAGTMALSGDLDPYGTKYVTLVNGAPVAVLSPWAVRPALSFGAEIP
ncbi:MAG: hypothetical protein FWD17_05555 [Polyangiaceae bacterium]|nr:hypothetical protein [Polyangiaceae bacterium]